MSGLHFTTEKLIAGDEENFEYIFRRYSREFYFVALGLSNDSEIARDAVQEAFIYLWEHRSGLRPGYPVRNYLRTIVKNKVLNHLRKREVQRRHEPGIVRETEECETDTEADLSEKITAARRLIDSLPEHCRKAFILAVIEGMGYVRAASVLGVSVNTVKSQVRIAYRKVREQASKVGHNDINLLLIIYYVYLNDKSTFY